MPLDATQINAQSIIDLFNKHNLQHFGGFSNVHCNSRKIYNYNMQLHICLFYPTKFIFTYEPLNISLDGDDFNDKKILTAIDNALAHATNVFKADMLVLIKRDRPNQVINKVLAVNKNKWGFWDVIVDMQNMFYGTKVLHTKHTLPYPLNAFNNLNTTQQLEWKFANANF